jgi:hypothetical protein
MRDKLSAFAGTFTNLLVVVTMITVITAIITLLPYASVHRRVTWIACLIIAVLGAVAVICEIRRLYRFDSARIAISRLLAEGEQLTQTIITNSAEARQYQDVFPCDTVSSHNDYLLMVDWCKRVEDVLRKVDESYVTRFHLGGSNEQDKRSMTLWKARHRLETLASFLSELK